MTGGANVEFNNFQGRGQVLSVGFEVGTQMSVMNNYGTPGKYESFNIRFMDPMFRDTPNRIGFSIFYTFKIFCKDIISISSFYNYYLIHLEDRETHIIFIHLTKDHEEHQYSGDGD